MAEPFNDIGFVVGPTDAESMDEIRAEMAKPYNGPIEVVPPDSHAAIARNAALSLRQRAAMPGLEDLRELYLELARMLLGLAETIDARELEIGVLRVERDAANERAAANAENARLWFDRVAALGALPETEEAS